MFNYVAEVSTYSNSYFGDHPVTYGMYFNCFGNETSLNRCQKSTTTCDFANVAGIYCIGDVVAGTVCMMLYLSNYKFSLTCHYQQGALKVACNWLMGVMKMKDGLKSAAMEYGGQSMLEIGIFTMPQLSVDSSDISNTQVSRVMATKC